MLQIEPHHYKIVIKILANYPYTFSAYGSRAKGTAHALSDLDLCSLKPIPRKVISNIQEDFRNSNLPYKVDIIDWNRCSADFQACIKDDLITLPCKENDPLTIELICKS